MAAPSTPPASAVLTNVTLCDQDPKRQRVQVEPELPGDHEAAP